jgi:hypothetical protein
LESDRARPEVAAFRELDGLVRRLTDQLAGYRRRAMAAEAKARELESSLERAVEKGEAALAAARAETASLRRVLEDGKSPSGDVTTAEGAKHAGAPRAEAAMNSSDLSAYGDIAVENERLRARLAEAKERTSLLVDRVRFLRQQMAQGAER